MTPARNVPAAGGQPHQRYRRSGATFGIMWEDGLGFNALIENPQVLTGSHRGLGEVHGYCGRATEYVPLRGMVIQGIRTAGLDGIDPVDVANGVRTCLTWMVRRYF